MSDLHEKRVEAAAKAIREVDARAALIADVDLAEYRARAALEAADAVCCTHPKCPGGSLCCCQSDAVVTEEQVKWQYGLQDSDGFVSFRNLSLRSLRKRAKLTGEVIVRRRPATKWEEVSNDTE